MPGPNEIFDVIPRFEELECSSIGLGMAALGRPGYINLGHADDIADSSFVAMQQHAYAMLDEAYASGIRYFDTAASYGAGEKFLGEWLLARGLQTSGVTVASKWGYTYTADWQIDTEVHEIKEHSLENLNRSIVWSSIYLGQALAVYQIHSATFESGVLDNARVLTRLAEIRQDGRLIGLTVSGTRQTELIDRALEVHIDGVPLFATVQATWNLLEPSSGPALARARDAGLAVIVKEALANGRLTERNNASGFKHKLTTLQQQADRLGCTPDALAIAAAVNQPWSSVTLSGATTIDQLHSNLAARNVSWDTQAEATLAELAESVEVYWRTRSGLQWN